VSSRILISLFIVFLALLIPDIANFIGLIGAIAAVTCSFILPIIVSHKNYDFLWQPIPLFKRLFDYFIIVVALIASGFGIYLSIKSMIDKAKKSPISS